MVRDPEDTLAARKAGRPKSTGSLVPVDGRCCGKLTFTGTGPENPTRYCTMRPLKGKPRCRFHNGQNAAFKDVAPKRIVETYEAALRDDQLTSTRKEIAWQRAYFAEIQRRCEAGELAGPTLFAAIVKVSKTWDAFMKASRGGSKELRLKVSSALAEAISDLTAAKHGASTDAAARKELRDTSDTMAHLIDKELKRVVMLQNMMTVDRVLELRQAESDAVIRALEKHISDVELRNAIRREIADLFGRLSARRHAAALPAAGGSSGGSAADPTASNT